MNGIAISKFVGFFAVSKFLGNLYLSEQIFNRKRSLGAPDSYHNYLLKNHDYNCYYPAYSELYETVLIKPALNLSSVVQIVYCLAPHYQPNLPHIHVNVDSLQC